ncbi:MAG: GNAT family N-acetyltransferase [Candidatus Cloacimonetes bacterium]|jgi:ribosomal protein S18 acetylase RimI-like enzyme|nr:GNAT family N-acetyltransferase [Candidatus Cloacimonadota bacterium]MDD2506171.1 GNAT family N-acetyltransferase [Candidatus Cloacimonadota bacterium]MDD4147636.1 GNAT family N-acetyltransferase [Candidatus Cloacimonadota bacterium]MDD4559341.1 GNAT family N-acetyltransferase [Candidatus Cloacimonadota bacterium]
MIIKHYKSLSEDIYSKIIRLWQDTGITNPARADSYEAIEHSLQNTGTIICAEEASEIVGAMWINHDFRRLYIHHMAVSPSRQNQGIGKKLLREALDIAKATGYQAKLEVHRDNPAARHLYSEMGFKDLDGYITMIKREL